MRLVTTFLLILAVAVPALAQAQDVDPDGAIHVLTGRHHHHRHHHVTIPRHRHHHVRRVGIKLPPGTSRPGPSRNFIPAR